MPSPFICQIKICERVLTFKESFLIYCGAHVEYDSSVRYKNFVYAYYLLVSPICMYIYILVQYLKANVPPNK